MSTRGDRFRSERFTALFPHKLRCHYTDTRSETSALVQYTWHVSGIECYPSYNVNFSFTSEVQTFFEHVVLDRGDIDPLYG